MIQVSRVSLRLIITPKCNRKIAREMEQQKKETETVKGHEKEKLACGGERERIWNAQASCATLGLFVLFA